MENEKKKMDELTKAKLIYSGELVVFGIVFAVLGVLILLEIINIQDWKAIAFRWVTLFGGFLLWGDFIWLLCSPKRKKKNCILDKILVLPSATFLIGYDLYSLITQDDSIIKYVMGGVFVYLACVYLFQGIYHWFYVHPGLLEEGTSEKDSEADSSAIEDKKEEKPCETPTDEKRE